MKQSLFSRLCNFLVPTPATVRRHRAPSARFVTLEAVAAVHGDSLKRNGRSYNLVTSDLRVLEFDNLAQVKSFLGEHTGLIATPAVAGYIEQQNHMNGCSLPEKATAPSILDETDCCTTGDGSYVERPRDLYEKATAPFVIVSAKPITSE